MANPGKERGFSISHHLPEALSVSQSEDPSLPAEATKMGKRVPREGKPPTEEANGQSKGRVRGLDL